MLGLQLFSIGTHLAVRRETEGTDLGSSHCPPATSQLISPDCTAGVGTRGTGLAKGPVQSAIPVPTGLPVCREMTVFAGGAWSKSGSSALRVTLSHNPACLKRCTNSKIPAVRRGKGKKNPTDQPTKTKQKNQQYSLSQGGPPPPPHAALQGEPRKAHSLRRINQRREEIKVVSEQDHYRSWEVETGFPEKTSKSPGKKPRGVPPQPKPKRSVQESDGQTERVESRCCQVRRPVEVTRDRSARARRAEALLSCPGCKQEGVTALWRDHK